MKKLEKVSHEIVSSFPKDLEKSVVQETGRMAKNQVLSLSNSQVYRSFIPYVIPSVVLYAKRAKGVGICNYGASYISSDVLLLSATKWSM